MSDMTEVQFYEKDLITRLDQAYALLNTIIDQDHAANILSEIKRVMEHANQRKELLQIECRALDTKYQALLKMKIKTHKKRITAIKNAVEAAEKKLNAANNAGVAVQNEHMDAVMRLLNEVHGIPRQFHRGL